MTFLYWLAGSFAYIYGGLATARSVYREAAATSSRVGSEDSFFAAICGFFWPLAWTLEGIANYIKWFMKRPTRKQKLEKKAAEFKQLMADVEKAAKEHGLLIPELPMPSAAYVESAKALMKKELLAKAEVARKVAVQQELARQAAEVAQRKADMFRRMQVDPGSYPYHYYMRNTDSLPYIPPATYDENE